MLRLFSDSWIHGIPLPPFLNTRTTSECHNTAGFPRFCLIVFCCCCCFVFCELGSLEILPTSLLYLPDSITNHCRSRDKSRDKG